MVENGNESADMDMTMACMSVSQTSRRSGRARSGVRRLSRHSLHRRRPPLGQRRSHSITVGDSEMWRTWVELVNVTERPVEAGWSSGACTATESRGVSVGWAEHQY
ncbi:hypothetical protein GSI_07857 [Ganoderma sinense ZZ0214-1]|uniref:Uncharacterized protein n=1 Tax=Ganoderma sinense ZZ0214-1 TaxID=1077348 RepID=A0A2G8S842_9APHY|nr:hypothetical protein GSI_07857 [Ganoderma sinense ZZ0214-1]